MTNKFQSYVKIIKSNNIFSLIIVPMLVVILLMYYVNPFLYFVEGSFYNYIGIFQDYKEAFFAFDNYSDIIHQITKFLFALLVMTKISGISLNCLGISRQKSLSYYVKGILLGTISIFSVFIIIFILHGITVHFVEDAEIIYLIKVLIFFVFQGIREELFFRGYLLPMFSKKMGFYWSTIIVSIFFTVIHLENPNISFLGILNIFLIGVTFSLIYYYTGSLLLVGAMHTFWNFIIAFILGSPVSGMVTYNSILISAPVENKDLISGGLFGFEASIVTTIVELAIILFMIYLIRKEKNKFLGDTFMKKEIIYNKLIRDNVLEIISNNNQKSSYHIATDEEYKNKLLEKLQEEVCEFTTDKNEEELADIFEVIEHIITAFNFNKEKILEIREKKAEKNGKFSKKIILEKVFNMEK